MVNLFLFPLSDSHLWQAIGAFLNALLALLVGVPTATTSRCALAGGFAQRPSMCTPDFAPPMRFAAEGTHHLGVAIDNFFDMAFLLIMYGSDTPCPTTSSTGSTSAALGGTLLDLSLFGTNSTVLIALGANSHALTDGQHAIFFKASGARRSYYPNLWGANPINPRYGVAALTSDSMKMMMGCSCADGPAGLEVRCFTVPTSGGGGSSHPVLLNTTWETAAEPKLLTCANVRIIVQSVRWPQRRLLFAQQTGPLPPPQPQTNRLAADAVVYVIPSCGGKGANPMACFDPTIFTLSRCFPFCMALHIVGGRPALDFRGYTAWRDGVLLTARDCVPLASSSFSSHPAVSTACSAQLAQADTLDSCAYASACATWVANKTLSSPAYTANIPAFADTERQVLLPHAVQLGAQPRA